MEVACVFERGENDVALKMTNFYNKYKLLKLLLTGNVAPSHFIFHF